MEKVLQAAGRKRITLRSPRRHFHSEFPVKSRQERGEKTDAGPSKPGTLLLSSSEALAAVFVKLLQKSLLF